MQTVFISSAIHSHRADAHFLTGANDPQGYFASVCDEYFLKHAIKI
jgi:hypothetical protein